MNTRIKLHIFIVIALSGLLLIPVLGMASGSMPALEMAAGNSLISVDWLAKNLKKKDMVILDVGAFTHYEKNHIPGAIKAFGPWQTMNDKFVGFMMPATEDLVQMLRSYGVNNSSFIIVYDEGITVDDTAKSARALWTLHVLGHNNVAVLDGGYTAWERAEQEVTKDVPVTSPGNFEADFKAGKVVTLDEVKSKVGSKKAVFVDTRIPEEHFGHEKVSLIKRFGHLPGAKLWPAKYMTNAGVDFAPSLLKNVDELKQMAAGIGIPADKNAEIITFSNRGKSAAMGYFVLHDILGYSNVKIFDGSLLEYGSQKDLALEKNGWGFITN